MTPEEKLEAIKEVVKRLEKFGSSIDSWSNYASVSFDIEQYCGEIKEILNPPSK